jgi:hypothetical protein
MSSFNACSSHGWRDLSAEGFRCLDPRHACHEESSPLLGCRTTRSGTSRPTSDTRPRCGPASAEGPTGGPDVLALRACQSRPILTTPAAVLRDPPPGRESALSTVGVMPAVAWRACLVAAPAELSIVGTAPPGRSWCAGIWAPRDGGEAMLIALPSRVSRALTRSGSRASSASAAVRTLARG